ncbi:hypothetical protein [Flavobacterium sp. H122]|uniref:hypothetical protein n=1 Tax=Flavobacterium sp. H122 TaxID=2529860 RepID=UPI0010AA5E7D|nr:hypothetical protein [Flavobacterium sp. H122]
MRTLLIALFFTTSLFAKVSFDNQPEKRISGLNIVTYETKKLGKHIYVVSDHYTKKKVQFINQNGKVIYSTKTVGSPIKLEKIESGIYYVKVTENNNIQIIEYKVD